ncbi:peptidoglycan-binding protein, partial [Peribacillus butanolivorans]
MTTDVITRPIIKIGSKGPEVAKIQTALQNLGFSPGSIDSDFGLKTDQAVRYFQIDHHLKVDGIVGKDTWALLQKFSTPTQGAPVNTTPQMQKYPVQPGDSLWKIADKYQVNLDEVRNANPDIHDPNNLQ